MAVLHLSRKDTGALLRELFCDRSLLCCSLLYIRAVTALRFDWWWKPRLLIMYSTLLPATPHMHCELLVTTKHPPQSALWVLCPLTYKNRAPQYLEQQMYDCRVKEFNLRWKLFKWKRHKWLFLSELCTCSYVFLLRGTNVGSSSSLKLAHYVNLPHTVVM